MDKETAKAELKIQGKTFLLRRCETSVLRRNIEMIFFFS